MIFALGAGDLFKLDRRGEFEETIISKCIDQYIAISASHHAVPLFTGSSSAPKLATSFVNGSADPASVASPTTPFSQSTLPSRSLLSRASTGVETLTQFSTKAGAAGVDNASTNLDRQTQTALQNVIERLFESCMVEGRYRQVVGIAVEARNLEVLRRVIKRASDDEKKAFGKQLEGTAGPTEELMEYVLDICMGVVQERALRTEILKLILDVLNDIPTPDYFSIAKCVVYLNQDAEAATILRKLVVSGIDPCGVNSTNKYAGKR